jgi:hypothetical protein
MAGGGGLTRVVEAVVACGLSILLPLGCARRDGGCHEGALAGVELLPGEVFLTSCPAGNGRWVLTGTGFSPGERLDLVFDSTPLDPISVRPGVARADPAGRLRVVVVAPPGARFARVYGSRGHFAVTPLVPGPSDSPQGR